MARASVCVAPRAAGSTSQQGHVQARARTEMLSRRAKQAGDLDEANARLAAAEESAERLRRRLGDSQSEVKRLRKLVAAGTKRIAFLEGSCRAQARECEAMACDLKDAKASLHVSAAHQRRLQTAPVAGDMPSSACGFGTVAAQERTAERAEALALKVRRMEASLEAKDGLLQAQKEDSAALKKELNVMADALAMQRARTSPSGCEDGTMQEQSGEMHLLCAKLKAQVRALALDAAGKTAELKGLRSEHSLTLALAGVVAGACRSGVLIANAHFPGEMREQSLRLTADADRIQRDKSQVRLATHPTCESPRPTCESPHPTCESPRPHGSLTEIAAAGDRAPHSDGGEAHAGACHGAAAHGHRDAAGRATQHAGSRAGGTAAAAGAPGGLLAHRAAPPSILSLWLRSRGARQVEEQASTIATLHDMKQQLLAQLHAHALSRDADPAAAAAVDEAALTSGASPALSFTSLQRHANGQAPQSAPSSTASASASASAASSSASPSSEMETFHSAGEGHFDGSSASTSALEERHRLQARSSSHCRGHAPTVAPPTSLH